MNGFMPQQSEYITCEERNLTQAGGTRVSTHTTHTHIQHISQSPENYRENHILCLHSRFQLVQSSQLAAKEKARYRVRKWETQIQAAENINNNKIAICHKRLTHLQSMSLTHKWTNFERDTIRLCFVCMANSRRRRCFSRNIFKCVMLRHLT